MSDRLQEVLYPYCLLNQDVIHYHPNPAMGYIHPLRHCRCGARPGAIPALAFPRNRRALNSSASHLSTGTFLKTFLLSANFHTTLRFLTAQPSTRLQDGQHLRNLGFYTDIILGLTKCPSIIYNATNDIFLHPFNLES